MHQLVYISTARAPIPEAELRQILDVSVRNNGAVGVTGLLVTGGSRFLQVLEGPTQAVLSTYERIQKDDRHMACVILRSLSISERSFGDWAMALHHGRRPGAGDLRQIVEQLTADMEDKNLQAQFRSFAELHDAA